MSKHKTQNEVAKVEASPLAIVPAAASESTVMMTQQERLYPVARMVHGMRKKENKENPYGPAFVQVDMVIYPQREKIADQKTPFNMIFLRNTLEWANFEEVMMGGKVRQEWRSEEPRHPGNEDWPLEYTLDGKKMVRYRQITLYVLIPQLVENFLKDALSETPSLSGGVTPVAIKTRNFSRKFAQQILDIVGGAEFLARNRKRVASGFEPIPVYAYEHVIAVEDFTNKKGDTFPILVYKKSIAVQNEEVRQIAADAYSIIAHETNLATVTVEDDVEGGTRRGGEVSDEV